MIVEAMCIGDAFDNGKKGVREPRRYYRGSVPDFDTENIYLNALTNGRGEWMFQYPGHEGVDPQWHGQNRKQPKVETAQVAVEIEPVSQPAKSDKRKGRKLTDAQIQKMKNGAAAARARKQEQAAA